MVPYDVTSLLTNIPLKETIYLTIDLLFEAKPDLKISRKDLQKLFQFATSQTNFLFNGSTYDQVDSDIVEQSELSLLWKKQLQKM